MGKTALVTGGNSGLGLEVAKGLIKSKCKVIILGKDKAKVEKAIFDLKSNLVTSVTCDLRSQTQIEKTVQQIGDIDIAGIYYSSMFLYLFHQCFVFSKILL